VKAAVVREPGADPVWADFDEPVVDERHRLAYLVGAGIHPVVRSMVGGGHYGSAGVWPAVPGVDAVARTTDGELIYTGWIPAPWGTSGWPCPLGSASRCLFMPIRWPSPLASIPVCRHGFH